MTGAWGAARNPTGARRDRSGPVGPGADECQVCARMVWVGLPDPTDGCAAVCVSSLSNCGAVGRSRGSLARAASTSGRSPGGTAPRSGAACTIRYMTASEAPVPNGDCPLAA